MASSDAEPSSEASVDVFGFIIPPRDADWHPFATPDRRQRPRASDSHAHVVTPLKETPTAFPLGTPTSRVSGIVSATRKLGQPAKPSHRGQSTIPSAIVAFRLQYGWEGPI